MKNTSINLRAACQVLPSKVVKQQYAKTHRAKDPEGYKMSYRLKYQKNKAKRKEYNRVNKDRHIEYCRTNKDKIKAYRGVYYNANKDKYKAYRRAYREYNKEKLNQKGREYRDANKDKIKAYYQANKDKLQEYRDANRDKINSYAKTKVKCECGSTYIRAGKSNHLKTKKHIHWKEST